MDYYARLAQAQAAIEAVRATMEDPQEVKPVLVVGDIPAEEFAQLKAQLAPQIEAELAKREEWRAAKAAREAAAAEAAGEIELEVEVVPEPGIQPAVKDGVLMPIVDEPQDVRATLADVDEYAVLTDEPEEDDDDAVDVDDDDAIDAEADDVDEPAELEPEEEREPEWNFPVVGEKHKIFLGPHHEAMPDACWHYVGKMPEIQVEDIVGKAKVIHNMGSVAAVTLSGRAAARMGIIQEAFIQVNMDGKAGHGISPDYMPTIKTIVAQSPNLRIIGFSTTASYNPEAARKAYTDLVAFRDSVREDWEKLDNVSLDLLSFGSKDDLEVAIECGSNFIRF